MIGGQKARQKRGKRCELSVMKGCRWKFTYGCFGACLVKAVRVGMWLEQWVRPGGLVGVKDTAECLLESEMLEMKGKILGPMFVISQIGLC